MKSLSRRVHFKGLLIVLATAASTTLAAANAPLPLPALPAAVSVFALNAGGVLPTVEPLPTAHAGHDRSAVIGQAVTLDGAGSTDLAGNRLSYHWTLRTPEGSGATLSDAAAARPQFTVDLLGDYIAELVVSNGDRQSEPASVRVSTGNVAPVAIAGADRHVNVGETVLLDATKSSDVNGDALNYRWSVQQAPAGSRASLQNARASTAAFTPDREGDYALSLIANDGRLDSVAATLRLTTGDARPFADAGADWVVTRGATVQLDGRQSFDPEGKSLNATWSLLHAPAWSTAELSRANTLQPSLIVDLPGVYVAQLVVSDGSLADAADTVVIEAIEPSGSYGPTPAAEITAPPPSRGGTDVDGDGIPDVDDNCVDQFNPTQFDSNGDGFGNRCDPDLDNDGFITNFGDLGLLKQAFFSDPSSPNWNPDADFNEDNQINFLDLGIMKSFFFGPPGPLVITFTNPAGGDWHDPANWSPPVVPTTIHAVRIDLDPGVVVEYSSGSSQINGLQASSPVLISGGELSITPADLADTLIKNAQFNGGLTIQGGATLSNANILAPDVMPAPEILIPNSQTVTLDGVTLGADLTISPAATLIVENDLELNGAITLASDNNSTRLRFSGAAGETSILSGTGEVVFGGTATVDDRNRIEVSGSTHGLTMESGITVLTDTTGGEFFHNSNNGPVTIRGTILSNLAGREITLEGYPLTIEGTLQTQNDGEIEANFGGTGSSIEAGATVGVNTGELELFGDFTNNAAITVTDGVLDIGNALADDWVSAGSITISNSTLELGGTFTLADTGTTSGTGTTVINGTFDNSGQTVDLGAEFPGAVELRTGGTILGGTVITTPLTVPDSQTFILDGVILNANMTVSPAATLVAENNLELNATITLASNNNSTRLRFNGAGAATSTFSGTGEVVFGGTATVDDRNRIEVNGSTHGLIIESGITVRTVTTGGEFFHNSNNGPVTIRGKILSNLAGRKITLEGFPLIIEGTLQTQNDGEIEANFGGVGSSIDAGATVDVNTGELELWGDFTNNAAIKVTDGVLDIGNAVSDDWVNAGSITINNSTLQLGGTFTLADTGTISGTGTTVIDGTFDNSGQIVDLGGVFPGIVELRTGGTILGGTVITTPLAVPTAQTFTLDGVILNADVTVSPSATLIVENDLELNAAITLASNNNSSRLQFSGAAAATSTFSGTGEVVFGGTATVDDRNRIEVSGSTHGLTIESGITVRTDSTGGEFFHNSNNGPITIEGMILSNLAGRKISLEGFPLIIEGTLQTQNDGEIEANFGGVGSSIDAGATVDVNTGELALWGDFTNNAAITVTDGVLDIGNAVGNEWVNAGSITINNSTLQLGGTFTLADTGTISGTGTTVIDGTFDNSGQIVDLGGVFPGIVELRTGGTILGGTVITTPLTVPDSQTFILDGVILNANMTVSPGATLVAENNLELNATITLASNNNSTRLRFSGAAAATSTFSGTGEVVFGGTATVDDRNRIEVSGSTHGLTIESGITVRTDSTGGEFFHNSNNGPITIEGMILSNLAGRKISLEGFPLIIEGTLETQNDGEIEANFGGVGSSIDAGATVDVNTGELALWGDFTNNAAITVTDGVLDIGNAVGDEWVNAGSITINNSTLELGGTFTLADAGTISGTGTTFINGTFDNSGQTVDLGGVFPGTVEWRTGGTILGGTVTTTPLTVPDTQTFTLDGVILNADVTVSPSATLVVVNDLELNAAITLASNNNSTRLRFSGAAAATSTFSGTGEVVFGGTATVDDRNRIEVSGSTHGLTIESGITVRTDSTGGEFFHNSNNGPITIEGTIISNLAGREITLEGFPLIIDGNLRAAAGSTIDLDDYTLTASAELDVEIGGTATTEFGRFTSNDDAELAGILDIAIVNGFLPSVGETFEIMTFGTRNGTFDTENGTIIGGGLSFLVNYNPANVTLEVVN